jgi:tetratricopeptide (TPR) repeat protein
MRGVAEAQAGTLSDALSDFDTAIRQSPRDARIWFNRGAVYARQGQYQLALSDLNKAIQLVPTFARAVRVRADVYIVLKDNTHALDDLDTALALGPPDSVALDKRASIYLNSGKYDEALADVNAALKLTPDDRYAIGNRCWARAAAKTELDLAMVDCNRALTIDPNNTSVMDSLAFVYFRQNQLQAAMDGYARVLAVNPKEASSLYMRGVIEKRLGKSDDSSRDTAAAQAIDPTIAKLYTDMGVTP